MVANPRPQLSEQVPGGPDLKNRNTIINKAVTANGRMGRLSRFQQLLLSHPYKSELLKVSEVPLSESGLPVYSPTLWSIHSYHRSYYSGKGGQTPGSNLLHSDSSVSGQLAHLGQRQTDLS